MAIIQEGFRLQEQHEVVMGLFKLDGAKQMIEGSMIEFCARLVLILVGAFAFMLLLKVIVPTIVQGLMMTVAILVSVWGTMSFLVFMNKNIAEDGIIRVAKHGLLLFALFVVIALVA